LIVDLLAVKNDCLDNCDKLLCYWFPICIICFQASGLPVPFILWNINAHKLITTHCCPAFCPNTTTSPYIWRFYCFAGIHIVHTRKKGFYLYHYKACSLFFVQFPLWFTPFYSLYGKLHYMANILHITRSELLYFYWHCNITRFSLVILTTFSSKLKPSRVFIMSSSKHIQLHAKSKPTFMIVCVIIIVIMHAISNRTIASFTCMWDSWR